MERREAPDRANRRGEGVSLGAKAALVLIHTLFAVFVLSLWASHHGGRWSFIQGPPALSVSVRL